MNVERIADAKAEAISLDEARKQCRILGTDSDDTLRIYIEAARNNVENQIKNVLVEGTYAFYFDESDSFFEIYRPIVSITTFEYKTSSNTGTYAGSLTGSDYHLDEHQGIITLNDNAMTDIYDQRNAIKITAVTGQEKVGSIKADIKLAMLLMIGHWHENREAVSVVQLNQIPMGAAALLGPYRAYSL
jgi:uncharacterized phiE125 gp8 family phage protein